MPNTRSRRVYATLLALLRHALHWLAAAESLATQALAAGAAALGAGAGAARVAHGGAGAARRAAGRGEIES